MQIKAEHFEQAWKRGASGGTFQHTNKSAKEKMEQQQQNTPKEHVRHLKVFVSALSHDSVLTVPHTCAMDVGYPARFCVTYTEAYS